MLASCKNDDDQDSSQSLVGKWKVTSLEYYQCTGTTANSVRTCGTFAFCATWEFKTDGTTTIVYDGGGTATSTYTIYPGNSVGICASTCSNMTYAITGTKLVLSTVSPAGNDCLHRYTFEKM